MSTVRAVITGLAWSAITCQNVLHFRNPDGAVPLATICTELRDNWCTILAAGQTTQFGWRNISVQEVGSAVAPTNLAIVVNGIDATDPSGGTQVLCQKFRIHTPVAGRHGRGRIYLPGYRATLWSTGQLNATGITNMTIRLNAIKARYVGVSATGPITLGVLRRGGTTADFINADDLSLALVPGVQRRRSLGLGI